MNLPSYYLQRILFVCLVLYGLLYLITIYSVKLESQRINCYFNEGLEVAKENLVYVPCAVTGHEHLQCVKDNANVYFPFNKFLKQHYQAVGKFRGDAQSDQNFFERRTMTETGVTPQLNSYDPRGVFGFFDSYNVEGRFRVQCISPKDGVPMSIQWSQTPYFYPIQIAQYALQHYSKNLTDIAPVVENIGLNMSEWIITDPHGTIIRSFVKSNETEFIINSQQVVKIAINRTTPIVSFFWKAKPAASFSFLLKHVQLNMLVRLNFVQQYDKRCAWKSNDSVKNLNDSVFYFALGQRSTQNKWKFICRDLSIDVRHALLAMNKQVLSSSLSRKIQILAISFQGDMSVRNLQTRTSAHMDQFQLAADWFVQNQNERGGWHIPVQSHTAFSLKAGWHSAMAQGHALSVLTRAYYATGDMKYLDVAAKGLNLFKIAGNEGGVRNEIFGHTWYEEYPTTPGTFVLNGFLYSLIGLYDFCTSPVKYSNDCDVLLSDGLSSLQSLLPLFDTGSGSIYDLRHITLQIEPNLAKSSYHALHIKLLAWLYNIFNEHYLYQFADRWTNYSLGYRAAHN